MGKFREWTSEFLFFSPAEEAPNWTGQEAWKVGRGHEQDRTEPGRRSPGQVFFFFPVSFMPILVQQDGPAAVERSILAIKTHSFLQGSLLTPS